MSAPYRAEIDGLRAIAILPVVTFHLVPTALPAGFLGVDIFFIISGFLITRILMNDLQDRQFSIVNFYERRVRRILPAVSAMLIASLLYGYAALSPIEEQALVKSILSATLFVSNFYFYAQSGYFELTASTLYLLHTWSLAVEEQFYILFPLALFALFQLGRTTLIKRCIWLAGLLSFAAYLIASQQNPDAAFYLPWFRAWELLAGAALVFVQTSRMPSFCFLLGVLLALGSLVFHLFSPGLASVLPCLGAGLVIYGGAAASESVKWILSNSLMTWIGRMSYSIYIWHWPIIVMFKRELNEATFSVSMSLIIALLILIVSIASYFFIEQPFRARTSISRRALFKLAAACSLMIVTGAGFEVAARSTGYQASALQNLDRYAKYDYGPTYKLYDCFVEDLTWSHFKVDACAHNVSDAPSIFVWGDSMAAHLVYGLQYEAGRKNIRILQATGGGCPPIANYAASKPVNCAEFNSGVLKQVRTEKPALVLLAGRWNAYPDFMPKLLMMVSALNEANLQAVVIGPQMDYVRPLPSLLAQNLKARKSTFDTKPLLVPEIFKIDNKLRAASIKAPQFKFISLLDLLCPGRECPVFADRDHHVPFVWDEHHLTAEASKIVAAKVFAALPPLGSASPKVVRSAP